MIDAAYFLAKEDALHLNQGITVLTNFSCLEFILLEARDHSEGH